MGKTKAIREAVKAELRVNPLVDDTDITVMNMGGDVTLTGVVTSYPKYLEAAAVARGVRRGEKRAQSPGGRATAA